MSELNAKIIEVNLLRERVTQLRTENDALERERDAMSAALRDIGYLGSESTDDAWIGRRAQKIARAALAQQQQP